MTRSDNHSSYENRAFRHSLPKIFIQIVLIKKGSGTEGSFLFDLCGFKREN